MFHPARTSSALRRLGVGLTALAAYTAYTALTGANAAEPLPPQPLPPVTAVPDIPPPVSLTGGAQIPLAGGGPPEIIPLVPSAFERPDMTGGYVGFSLGVSRHLFDARGDAAFRALTATASSDTETGFAGGLLAGYDLDLGGFLVGGEADATIGALDDDVTVSAGGTTASLSTDLVWLGTARLRAGATWEGLTVYATGGLAFGAADVHAEITAPGGTVWTGSEDQAQFGYALGLGAEYTFGNRLSLRGEYLHYDLGDVDVALTPNGAAATTGQAYTAGTSLDGDLFRLAATYKLR